MPHDGESAASMRRRAAALRAAAARGRRVAGALDGLLEHDVTTARSAGLWYGTFARETTAMLEQEHAAGRRAAEDLVAATGAWLREAEHLEDAADVLDRTPAGAR